MNWKSALCIVSSCVVLLGLNPQTSSANTEALGLPTVVDTLKYELKQPKQLLLQADLDEGTGQLRTNLQARTATDKQVTLRYVIYRQEATGNLVALESGSLYQHPLGKALPVTKSLSLQHLMDGQYQLELQADSKQTESESWGDAQTIQFRVEARQVKAGWAYLPMLSSYPAVDERGTVTGSFLPNEGPAPISPPAPLSLVAPEAVAASGTWKVVDRNGVEQPVPYAKTWIEVKNSYGQWTTAATSYTDANGRYSFSLASTGYGVRVQMTTESLYNRIYDINGYTYTWNALPYSGWTGGDMGTHVIPSTQNVAPAAWMYLDMQKARNLMLPHKDPGYFKIKYDLNSTSPLAYFDPGKDEIFMSGYYVKSTTITLHELGHQSHWNVYNKYWPSFTCPSSNTFETSSNANCAWIEGWPTFIPFVVNNAPIYNWGNGASQSFENTSGFPSFSDAVSGLVVASLWDLYDSSADGVDTVTYTFGQVYRAMYSAVQSNLKTFWDTFKAQNGTVGKVAFHQNKIYYY